MTKKEHERLAVVRQVMRRELKQKVAAELLSLSTRQVRNLVRKDRAGWGQGTGPRQPGQALAETDGSDPVGSDRRSGQEPLSGLQAEVRGRKALEE